jgi:uncharacterized membrane protein YvbJ
MVYCSKCGAKNEDDARTCAQCGANLYAMGGREHHRHMESECFGIPRGGAVASLVFGLIIILVGVSLYVESTYNIQVHWWPIVIVIFGVLIAVGALYGMRQRR